MNLSTFNIVLYCWIALGLLIFILLLFVTAPYGRHTNKKWGALIPNKLGWVLMELPSLVIFSTFFLAGTDKPQPLTWVFFGLYVAHYTNRSLIYPFRTRTKGKKMPVIIVLSAICFNLVNGSLNGYYFSAFSREYTVEWLYDARFIIGMVFFITGFIINAYSDHYLLHLRKKSGNGYQIPEGGLFNYISCPNFFGEIIEWTGFAIMTWSPAALAFALWTFFNLAPRAFKHHKWYSKEFPEYPENRKALIPFIL